MATIDTSFTTGKTVYAVVRNDAGQVYNTTTSLFENYTSADWTDYAIALTEQVPTGYYTGPMPVGLTNPPYSVQVFAQSGVIPATSDYSFGGTTITSEDLGTGDGPNVVTVTVVDQNNHPLQNAVVIAQINNLPVVTTTNATGIAIFGLDSGSYQFSSSLAGYQSPSPATVSITTNQSVTIQLSQIAGVVITAPSVCSCFGSAFLSTGQAEAGLQVTFNLIANPTSMQNGQIFDSSPVTATTNASGELSTAAGNFVSLYQTAAYSISIGNTVVVSSYVVPAASSATLPALVGTP